LYYSHFETNRSLLLFYGIKIAIDHILTAKVWRPSADILCGNLLAFWAENRHTRHSCLRNVYANFGISTPFSFQGISPHRRTDRDRQTHEQDA